VISYHERKTYACKELERRKLIEIKREPYIDCGYKIKELRNYRVASG